jgi:4'-phosphopantetheinyl transferase
MSNAVLHLIDPASRNGVMDSSLSQEELARARRFVFPEDASRWTCYRSALREILGAALGIDPRQVPLIEGPGGKPALAPPYTHLEFNLSHSDDLAAVIVSERGPVGIDLEPWSRAPSLIECAEVFCHPDELAQLPSDPEARATRLLETWTAKEALLKALGSGLSYPPRQLKVDGNRGSADTPLEGLSDLHLIIPIHPEFSDHRIAVAVSSKIQSVEWQGHSFGAGD